MKHVPAFTNLGIRRLRRDGLVHRGPGAAEGTDRVRGAGRPLHPLLPPPLARHQGRQQ